VADANPLGAALGMMLGVGAAAVTAWQQALMATVFELCLVGVMVAFALLGHTKAFADPQAEATSADVATTPPRWSRQPRARRRGMHYHHPAKPVGRHRLAAGAAAK
jgi:hypothetical protein